MSPARFAVCYALFAAVATATNIGTQWVSVHTYAGRWSIPASVIAGTGIGLLTKYILDKKWIFGFQARDRRHEARTFALYTAMGLVTTAIFWGTETIFHFAFKEDSMRYLGGVIGLAIGYWAKYRLDRRYVFS